MTLYKVLNPDGKALPTMTKWSLPEGGTPGAWMPRLRGELVLCENGYHLAPASELLQWVGHRIFEAEYRGDKKGWIVKVAVRQARLVRECTGWNAGTAVLFAADCAAHVLPLFEAQRPGDDRPRKAVAAARLPAAQQGSDAARLAGWAGAMSAAAEAAGMTDGALAECLIAGLSDAGDRVFVPRKYIGRPGSGPRLTRAPYLQPTALYVAQRAAKARAPGNAAWAAALAAAAACNLKCALRAAFWASAWGQVAVAAGDRARAGRWATWGPVHRSFAGSPEEDWQTRRLLRYVESEGAAADAPAEASAA